MNNFKFIHSGEELWYSRSVAVAVFVVSKKDNKYYILSNKRGKGTPDFQGYWNCPCGYLDFNESLEEAAVRETFEETGVKIDQKNLIMFFVDSNPKDSNKQNVTIEYLAQISYCELSSKNAELNEVDDVRWIPLDEIDDYKWAFNHDEIIKKRVWDGYITFRRPFEQLKEKFEEIGLWLDLETNNFGKGDERLGYIIDYNNVYNYIEYIGKSSEIKLDVNEFFNKYKKYKRKII